MTAAGWLQLVLYIAVLLALAKPLGSYMAAVYEARAPRAERVKLSRLDLGCLPVKNAP